MAPEVAEVESALLALAPDERATVIEHRLLSLEDVDAADQAEVDEVWLAEINRRVAEYASGDVRLIDANQHFAQLRAKRSAREPRRCICTKEPKRLLSWMPRSTGTPSNVSASLASS